MNVEMIKELIKAFKEGELTDLSLKCEEFELKLGKKSEMVTAVMPNTVDWNRGKAGSTGASENHKEAAAGISESAPLQVSEEEKKQEEPDKVIKAPIVGTFYRAGSPNGEPFVKVGSYVHKGDVICVIEAMKLMNEVEAEEEGEVAEILVQNEEMVEYNQPLIVLR